MIQIILVIYLSISISSLAKEKGVSAVPYILATIAITIAPSLVAILMTGKMMDGTNIVAAVIGIGLAFIPRSSLRNK